MQKFLSVFGGRVTTEKETAGTVSKEPVVAKIGQEAGQRPLQPRPRSPTPRRLGTIWRGDKKTGGVAERGKVTIP
ncbi:MAG: hypothetical protein HZA08_09870 [Nitrospirae bacterium]|nr:hypothetical protein [Nitrospirota bacterium]